MSSSIMLWSCLHFLSRGFILVSFRFPTTFLVSTFTNHLDCVHLCLVSFMNPPLSPQFSCCSPVRHLALFLALCLFFDCVLTWAWSLPLPQPLFICEFWTLVSISQFTWFVDPGPLTRRLFLDCGPWILLLWLVLFYLWHLCYVFLYPQSCHTVNFNSEFILSLSVSCIILLIILVTMKLFRNQDI